MKAKTDVVFRVWKDTGDVIALFPGDCGTSEWWTCSSYMHMGQHGAADPRLVVQATRPATHVEYRPLKKELEAAPYRYRLRTVRRIGSHYAGIRRRKLTTLATKPVLASVA